jgi:hypothetical protein
MKSRFICASRQRPIVWSRVGLEESRIGVFPLSLDPTSPFYAHLIQSASRGKGVPSVPSVAPERSPPNTSPDGTTPMFVQLVKDFQGQKAGTRIDVTEADAKILFLLTSQLALRG